MSMARRGAAAAAVVAVMVLAGPQVAGAGRVTPPEVTYGEPVVTGEAVCQPDGTQLLTWTARHPLATQPDGAPYIGIILDSAVMSGAASGPVTLAPSPLDVGQAATGSATVPGTAVGAVDLLLEAHYDGWGRFQTTGQANLAGCAPEPTTTTTAAVEAVAAPRFTG